MSAKRKSLTSDQTDRLYAENSIISLRGLASFVQDNRKFTAGVISILFGSYVGLLIFTVICQRVAGV